MQCTNTSDALIDRTCLRLLPLHRYLQYQEKAFEILNEEWPQSRAVRLRRFEKSCDTLPTSYVLVVVNTQQNSFDNNEVIGYCYVDRLYDGTQNSLSLIIESVVIQRKLRGQGYGQILMSLIESELVNDKSFGIADKALYLTTTDQCHFYKKCGFNEKQETLYKLNISHSCQYFPSK
ncbi:unnamed protein product [Didymodactylos carnosus]|uniref:N-acetyltransferase domain-containing protein n=1 Tax=Didymodactylos carnosus TaxID=1234261 RepID=A0A8S2DSW6_9BILA|nr:unnamed protein product [Didymodactylos carnosus]CAF3737763.1 unnamed protein product [Didymodactylos carnosus]